nr:MAG TPA: hypothetical protein [Bacteriophage sp.]
MSFCYNRLMVHNRNLLHYHPSQQSHTSRP